MSFSKNAFSSGSGLSIEEHNWLDAVNGNTASIPTAAQNASAAKKKIAPLL